jgi:dTMP kinase
MSTIKGGLFVTFEGPDGSGKTTQMRMLAEKLRGLGYEVLETAEPGGTRIGNKIREILLDKDHQEMSPTAEMLLYFAARAQNVDEFITPALREGKVVLSDRYTDSTMAYQGMGRGLGEDVVNQLHHVACHDLQPQLTLCYDIDVETGLARARVRGVNRMDDQAVEFHQKVRKAYLRIAQSEPRVKVLDGNPAPGEVFQETWRVVAPMLTAAPE